MGKPAMMNSRLTGLRQSPTDAGVVSLRRKAVFPRGEREQDTPRPCLGPFVRQPDVRRHRRDRYCEVYNRAERVMARRVLMRASLAVWLLATSASVAAAQPALDYEFFKTSVQPIFLATRAGHARCIWCH